MIWTLVDSAYGLAHAAGVLAIALDIAGLPALVADATRAKIDLAQASLKLPDQRLLLNPSNLPQLVTSTFTLATTAASSVDVATNVTGTGAGNHCAAAVSTTIRESLTSFWAIVAPA